jgi:NAD(P)-dependent dehydrogenase (short-subunit alcohol dehydrogenase family)
MTDKKVWLVTGAGRGMGTEIVKAALAAGQGWSPSVATRSGSLRRSARTMTWKS